MLALANDWFLLKIKITVLLLDDTVLLAEHSYLPTLAGPKPCM